MKSYKIAGRDRALGLEQIVIPITVIKFPAQSYVCVNGTNLRITSDIP